MVWPPQEWPEYTQRHGGGVLAGLRTGQSPVQHTAEVVRHLHQQGMVKVARCEVVICCVDSAEDTVLPGCRLLASARTPTITTTSGSANILFLK
jgi:hypothetical protein